MSITAHRTSLREQAAEELRALLARRRMSVSELARRLGVAQSYMARRVDGRVALDLDDLESIAAILGVEVADLLPKGGFEPSVVKLTRGITGQYAEVNTWPLDMAARASTAGIHPPPKKTNGPVAALQPAPVVRTTARRPGRVIRPVTG